jgi:hypothetical protein
MIRLLKKLFPYSRVDKEPTHEVTVRGHLRLELRENGKLRAVREGDNICTLTGREFLAGLCSLAALNPARTPVRDDRIALIGVGTGAQLEVSNIQSLVSPVAYKPGEFLAPLAVPPDFPFVGADEARTAVQFTREFGRNEISVGMDVVLTEAGLFTDGDPNNNWVVPAPTDIDTTRGRAPMFYKTFEPITKTMLFTLRAIWEVRFV